MYRLPYAALLTLLAILLGPREVVADANAPALPMKIPVLVVKYFPVKGDRIDRTVTGDWGASLAETRQKTDRQTRALIDVLQEGSCYHGYKDAKAQPSLAYEVLDEIEFLEPMPTIPRPGHRVPFTDYKKIMDRVDIKKWVEQRGVKEVWIWGYHGGVLVLWESNMASPHGDISNSNRDPNDLPVLESTYTVYHYNYQRGVSEATENHMHQIEAVLNYVDGRDRTPPAKWADLLFWGKFVGSDRSHKIIRPGCGWSHYPPNGERDYDWANKRYVLTDIEDWQPDGTGAKQRMNCDRWGGDSLRWFVYWMQNLPGSDNGLSYRGKPLTNWWVFIGDFDYAMQRKMTLAEIAPNRYMVNMKTWPFVCLIALFGLAYRAGAGEQIVNRQGESEPDTHLPAGVKLYWGEEPIEPLSVHRGQICLNGIWEFVPMLDKAETEPPPGVAYIHVPGSWKPSWPMPGLASETEEGPAWKNWENGSKTWCAWYQRKVKVPAQWANRAILVSLERVSTDAIVYANGTKCGAIAWPYGEVDISNAVRAGREAMLWIQVMATSDAAPSESFLDPGRVVTTSANLESKGLIGDVFLRSRPSGTHISDIFVQTSTRKKELKLDIEVSDLTATGPVQFTAKLVDANGMEQRRFHGEARMNGNGTQVVQLAWNWDDPRLWDFQQPHLYTLKLEANGTGWEDEYAQPFGFREFWIDGRRFFLNGTEIRLRPTSHGYMETCFGGSIELTDAHIDGCLYAGFNCEECWPVNHDKKGSVNFRELWADRADRKGFLLIGAALPITPDQWTRPGYQQNHTRKLERELRRYRNHPSIVMWTTNPNWLGNGLDQDPRYLGRSETAEIAPTLEDWKKVAAKESVAAIKKLDPTRPILNHAGAYHGDVYNINCYLNLIPLQEREQWLSEWTTSGNMPLMCVEFGTPWKYTFLQGRWGFEASTESLATEYCAIYFGPDAYATETADYRQAIRKNYKGRQRFGDMGANWNTVIDALPAFKKLQALFNRNTYRSWRTWGVTGGMIPWDYGHGWDMFYNERRRKKRPILEQDLRPFTPGMRGIVRAKAPMNLVKPFQPGGMDVYPAGVALMEANSPTLAWIAGKKGEFTSKHHSFASEQTVKKQVVLINDERAICEYQYAWTAELDGKRVAADSGAGRIEPATTLFRPLTFHTPSVTGTTKASGTIELVATIGNREHKDVFSFRVFPKPAPLRHTVAVYDPVGKSTKMLESLGFRVRSWSGRPSSDLIVIGRETLSCNKPLPFDLEAAVDGGARVLICAQDPQWLQTRMGFRVAAHLSRRVFPVSSGHPICQNLDATDLADWTGESTLVEAKPRYPIPNQIPGWRSPKHGWHWGNQGVVTSAAIEKPHRSGWRPILECEFDLAYSPLMELEYGRGRLVLCTLDLEDHVAVDPAAAVLARNIMQYATTDEPIARVTRTVLVGDENDRKNLDNLGLIYQVTDGFEPDADLTIIGAQARYNETAVLDCLGKGGNLLFLSRNASDHKFGVKLERTPSARGSINVPAWPECRGLSPSDLHWRTDHKAWLVASGVEHGADGLLGVLRSDEGVAVFCQIDPDRFPVEQEPYFRLTRWRQTRALAQILANLGASFAMDREAFRFTPKQTRGGTEQKGLPGWYHADYRDDFRTGDDPYRYFRW